MSLGSTARTSSAVLPVPGSAPAAPRDPVVARARLLLLGLFALNGLTFSSWLARLPTVRDELGLSTGQLGTVLLAGSAGSLVMVMLAGALVTRFGGRRVLVVSTAGFTVAYVFMGIGPTVGSVAMLVVGVMLNGMSFALCNVPLNVETAAVERRMGRTMLPHFHAAFSIGAVVGSGLGGLASHGGVPLTVQLGVTAVVALAWRLGSLSHVILDTGVAARRTDLTASELAVPDAAAPSPVVPGPPSRRRGLASALDAWREPRTLLIGAVIMAAALSEGSANNWLSLAVVDGFGRAEAVGAVVLAVFIGSMTLVRLLGTRLIDRFGRVAVLRVSGLVALAGLLLFGLAPTLLVAGAGAMAWGFGAALAFPIGIAAASDDPMRAAARVSVISAFSSVASLAAPPLLGLVAQSIGIRHALLLITAAMVVSVLLARSVGRPEQGTLDAVTAMTSSTGVTAMSPSPAVTAEPLPAALPRPRAVPSPAGRS
ncbi:MAG TPA: MFS transporter [Cellulomonas sp.]|uniref:MFS transporter n=1 Tax=Cellulomonas sp. TaxID=40001 RepID=UPI002E37C982|nr:MFS transporter [Cellulomonas sp.]HEX5331315.1 MFS transporter [Cellulomonas sp.]